MEFSRSSPTNRKENKNMETPKNTEAAQRDGPENGDTHGIGRLAIYAASLCDYTSGIMHGVWIDADDDHERMQQEIDSMLAHSPTTTAWGEPAEEWAIHDYEGFGPLQLSEHVDLGVIARLAGGIHEHGAAFAAWAAWHGSTDQETLDRFEEAYLGQWHSVEGLRPRSSGAAIVFKFGPEAPWPRCSAVTTSMGGVRAQAAPSARRTVAHRTRWSKEFNRFAIVGLVVQPSNVIGPSSVRFAAFLGCPSWARNWLTPKGV
jgi:antirestriction protein